MPPLWLTVISWISLVVAFACAGFILYDIFGRGYRQHMWIMEVVWPVTALYFGPLAIWAYYRWGRPMSHRWMEKYGEPPEKNLASSVAVGVSHCGAGCTLGDIIGEWAVFLLGLEIAGLTLWPEYILDFVLAFILGIAFQYYSIKPMRGLSVGEGIRAALKADTLSLSAFEVGLFGWMALMRFVFFPVEHIQPDHVSYWFLMQLGMVLGFFTSYPVNWWLIRRHIKEPM